MDTAVDPERQGAMMREGKVQFKVIVDERVRETVRQHADQNGTDMSSTISTVVNEVLLGELDDEHRAKLDAPEAG
jgi:hypothetical protein